MNSPTRSIFQVFGTFILVSMILAITDSRSCRPQDKGLLPLALGAIVFGIGTCWALNCGYAINPARDLGPRIFTAIAGWGIEPFRWVSLSHKCLLRYRMLRISLGYEFIMSENLATRSQAVLSTNHLVLCYINRINR